MESVLFRLLRSRVGSAVAATWFRRFSFALPFAKLRETPTLLAFEHPVPSYEIHVLIVPKAAYPTMAEAVDSSPEVFAEVYELAADLVEDMQLDAGGYRVVVNGGSYQDVRLLHFHLTSDDPPS